MSRVCVHGLGYVGLPTAAILADAGHEVLGYDTDPAVRDALADGDVRLDEPGLESLVAEAAAAGALVPTAEVRPADYHVICVPTPIDEADRTADLSNVEAAGRAISPHLEPGDAVVLESTVPPRTTADVLRPILEASGIASGSAFTLVHSPETALPGDVIAELRGNDRIVGGVDGTDPAPAIRLYESFVEGEILPAPDATTAEFAKLAQNTYRDANVALANEFARLADDYGIDSREAIALANRHPRVDVHDPGPGVGGHCLPIDPWFLGHGSDELDLIARARAVNEEMVDYVIDVAAAELPRARRVKVAILGIAYKGGVADTRNSPGLAIARTLRARAAGRAEQRLRAEDHAGRGRGGGALATAANGGTAVDGLEIALHDSHARDESLCSLEEALAGANAAIVATDHDEYRDLDPAWVAGEVADVVVDAKGVFDPDAWDDLPVAYRRL